MLKKNNLNMPQNNQNIAWNGLDTLDKTKSLQLS